MAHNFGQVKTPRAYMDFINYYVHLGYKTYDLYSSDNENPNQNLKWAYLDPYQLQKNDVVGTDPTNSIVRFSFHHSKTDDPSGSIPAYAVIGANINYVAILSHELGGPSQEYAVEVNYTQNPDGLVKLLTDSTVGADFLNAERVGDYDFVIGQHGSSIIRLVGNQTMGEETGIVSIALRKYHQTGESDMDQSSDEHFAKGIGAVSFGTYIDFPQSPDMSLALTREFDFLQTTESLSGKIFSTTSNNGATFGHGEQPFGLYNYDALTDNTGGNFTWNKYSGEYNKFKRVGRRVWEVSWSQVGADDLFHAYESGNFSDEATRYSGITDDGAGIFAEWDGIPIMHDAPIFKLFTMTHAGRLPFIWQPDKDDNTPLGFCLAKVDMESFTMEQESFERYSFSLTIREVW